MLVPGILKFHDVSVKKKKDQNTDIFSYLMWLFRSRYLKNSLMLIELTSASFHVAPLIQWKKVQIWWVHRVLVLTDLMFCQCWGLETITLDTSYNKPTTGAYFFNLKAWRGTCRPLLGPPNPMPSTRHQRPCTTTPHSMERRTSGLWVGG